VRASQPNHRSLWVAAPTSPSTGPRSGWRAATSPPSATAAPTASAQPRRDAAPL